MALTTGSANTFVGGYDVSTGGSGAEITTGSNNTIIGAYNGNQGGLDIRTASNNIVLSDGDGNPRLQFGVQGTNSSGWRLFGSSHNNSSAIGCGEALQVLSEDSGGSVFGMLINFNAATYGSASNIRFYNRSTGTIVGSITSTTTSTSYVTSSDYRLKENVIYDWDATTRLKQLKPARFNFIADADRTVDGFIAHEAQEVVPECITGIKDAVDKDGNPAYQGIDQSKLVPLLVKTILELEARISTLEGN